MNYTTRTKIFQKIISCMLISMVSCVLLTSGSVYYYTKPVIENSLMEKRKTSIQSLCKQGITILEDIATYAKNITFDDMVQNLFRPDIPEGSWSYYSQILNTERRLKEYRMVYGSLIRDIFVIDKNGKAMEMVNTYGNLTDVSAYQRFFKGKIVSGFTPQFIQNYYGVIGKKKTIAYVNTIYDKNSITKELGKLIILLDSDQLNMRFLTDEDVFVCLSAPDGTVLFDNLSGQTMQSKQYIDVIDINEWKISYEVDNTEIEKKMGQMRYLIVLIITLILAVVLLITLSFLNQITAPLEDLIRGMRNIANGSHKEHIDIHTGDECEEAANIFNEMVESINQHTQQLVDYEKKQYNLQLKMLSYQLNPHFIYNTLNAIICLARKHSDETIIKLTRSLIMLLQLLLRTDLQSMTVVEKEQEYMNNYIHVLQMCYRNIPDITWDIEDGLEKQEIPRMILYPLVENSVFHGIVPSDRVCCLKISFSKSSSLQNQICVTVEDNGTGIPGTKLQEISEILEQEKLENHIGLLNVSKRLQLIYGEQQPLTIQSSLSSGTKVIFTIIDKKV